MRPSLEKMLAKQKELATRIRMLRKKETSQAGEAAQKRQRKLGRFVFAWMKKDQALAKEVVRQAKAEKWAPKDLRWLQAAAEGQK